MKLDETRKKVQDISWKGISVFALGGLDEVGKNMYCYAIEDELAIVDSGVLFPDESLGVDAVIQDFSFLKAHEDKIVGLFITHGHEDHIGSIPYLLNEVNVKNIYASGFAVSLIEGKLNQRQKSQAHIINFNKDSKYKFKNFSVEFFTVNHSIPDAYGICLKTKLGNILHTGDYKFDLTPIGPPFEFEKVTRYQKEGVLLLLADSTNAFVKKSSPSEKEVGESMKSIMSKISGRLIVAMFASNVYRMKQVIEASEELGRRVIVFGRSMLKNLAVAKNLGYLKVPEKTFIDPRDFESLKDDKITILCTGTQGEPMAALSRIADDTHKEIKLKPNDTVVFSSSAIPGNQASINKTINLLCKHNTKVILNSPLTDTHTSGHACERELKLMIALSRPKYFMPMHGEFSMLRRHGEHANAVCVPKENIFLMLNGDILEINEKGARCQTRISAPDVNVDTNNTSIDTALLWERKVLSTEGVVGINIAIDENGLLMRPELFTRGIAELDRNSKKADNIIKEVEKKIDLFIINNKNYRMVDLESLLTEETKNSIYRELKIKPIVIPLILVTKMYKKMKNL